MKITYKLGTPGNFNKAEKMHFLNLLIQQDQVANPTLNNITSCHFLCLVYDGKTPIGIGAIKEIYKTPFDKAKIPERKVDFDLELGYMFVLDKEDYRGKKIGKSICLELLKKVEGQNIFATTDENSDNPMIYILERNGFKKAGKTYTGGKTGKQIGLYLLDCNL